MGVAPLTGLTTLVAVAAVLATISFPFLVFYSGAADLRFVAPAVPVPRLALEAGGEKVALEFF